MNQDFEPQIKKKFKLEQPEQLKEPEMTANQLQKFIYTPVNEVESAYALDFARRYVQDIEEILKKPYPQQMKDNAGQVQALLEMTIGQCREIIKQLNEFDDIHPNSLQDLRDLLQKYRANDVLKGIQFDKMCNIARFIVGNFVSMYLEQNAVPDNFFGQKKQDINMLQKIFQWNPLAKKVFRNFTCLIAQCQFPLDTYKELFSSSYIRFEKQ